MLTLSFDQESGSDGILELELVVSRDEISRLSQSYTLNYAQTADGVTLRLKM